MNRYYLFLDDERTPKEVYAYKQNPVYVEQEWVIVRSYQEFVDKVAERFASGYTPRAVSFDHDLVSEHYRLGALSGFQRFDENAVKIPTGWYCLKWFLRHIELNDLPMPEILLHTKNDGGKMNMNALIDEYKIKQRNV